MPFTAYSSAADVAREFGIIWDQAEFVAPVPFALSASFLAELAFTMSDVPTVVSESAVCETVIYPLFRDVWKPFSKVLTLWNHETLRFDDRLSGVPDFIVARRSPLGLNVMDRPYLLVVEAKRDDFIRGWGQCLAAMLAAQNLNKPDVPTIHGIVTNGRFWEFGRLEGNVFTQERRSFPLHELDTLAAVIHSFLLRCREQLPAPAPAVA
jgi:hypothetical protein